MAQLRQYDEAEEHFETSIRLNPDSAIKYHNYAIALADMGKTERAAECYESAIQLAPHYARCYDNYGNLLARRR